MKTIEEINQKITQGKAVILTAEEVVTMAKTTSPKEIAQKVDVVTTGTFAPMCSSGAFMNFGHTTPPMRMEKIELDDVEVYGGVAAVDGYLGATQESSKDKQFGGAHIIEELIKGKDVLLRASAKGTDCYPKKEFAGYINKDMINDFFLFDPRNAYQNYAAATNGGKRVLYTYMGKLLPNYGNLTYSTSGELSPLLKDPNMLTIGLGTRIFLCGSTGYVVWPGTQFTNQVMVNESGIPIGGARTLAVIGDAKKMDPRYIRAAYFKNYGVTMFVGIGIPIPMINEDVAYFASRSNAEITTEIKDYSLEGHPTIGYVNYDQLRSGYVELNGKTVKSAPISSLSMAREIAQTLKDWIARSTFLLTEPVQLFDEPRLLKKLPEISAGKNLSKDEPSCVECGLCTSVCPTNALQLMEAKLTFIADKCTHCNTCSDVCPVGVRLPFDEQ
ncbi:homocysteine biosynthesis protein [Coprothermobacter platensis]|uniref:homocysteine biosynthesis protein n=1 Tax=Coprothermobacter platensis TaxID=108819 RepID=UPI000370D153|nr:homocysteine biosynthesis protein [Coprothermobacter platensis]